MKIALVLSENNQLIVPIVEGTIIRIYDTQTQKYEDFANPALKLASGKRGAVIKWLNESGINLLVTPPNTLCELSYLAAQKEDFSYYRVEVGTSFTEFQELVAGNQLQKSSQLPDNEIEPSIIPAVDDIQ